MMPRAFEINLRESPCHSSQIMEEIEPSERGQRAPRSKRNSRKKDEQTAPRKNAHAKSEPPADGSDPLPDEKQS